ncbi:head decoration protein [Rhodoferax sp.]|uniref:head decoration protein n=1 Tax=Rhodoferax sp. TaxID=50421 RepID=UPI002637AB8E|nr:head decoration protein [Rhodoferax sp.]MDD2809301.1 head decoration protein [Rhodoferax sp.]MDD4942736.1 head decoration protein [Rhodoferax sp.]
MTNKTLAAPLTDLVLYEAAPIFCRDVVTLGAGSTSLPGTVLAKNAAGDYNPVDFAGVNGAELAFAVSVATVDATAGAKPCTVISRGAVLDTAGLLWPAGATAPQKAAAIDRLTALGIVTKVAL